MAEASKIYIFGQADPDPVICAEVRKAGNEPIYQKIEAPDRFNFDLSGLAQIVRGEADDAMILIDSRGLNVSRAKVFFELKLFGFKLTPFISSNSVVSSDSSFGDGSVVMPMSFVGAGTKIGVNSQVGLRVTIGRNVRIGKHVTIRDGAVIGDNSVIDDYVTIGQRCDIQPNSKIGRYSELALQQTYSGAIAECSFFWWPGYGPARVFDFSN